MEGICRMCRLCGGSTEFGTSLLDPSWKRIADEATKLFLLEINSSNGFPTRLCSACVKKVEDLMLLKSTCLISHRYFCRLLGVPKTCGVVESTNVVNNLSESPTSEQVDSPEHLNHTNQCDLLLCEKDKLLNLATSSSGNGLTKRSIAQKIGSKSQPNKTNEGKKKIPKIKKRELRVVLKKINVKKYMSQNNSESLSDPNLGHFLLGPDSNVSQNYPNTEPISQVVINENKIECNSKDTSCVKRNNSKLCEDTKKIKCTCSICGTVLSCAAYLKRHMLIHKRKQFECNLCNLKCVSLASLRRHVIAHHPPIKPKLDMEKLKFVCPICSIVLTSSIDLSTHMLVHKEKYNCSQCKHQFHSIHSLNHHIQKVHNSHKIHKCFKCGVTFINETSLIQHVKSTHVLYSCNECSCSFESQILLTRHLTNTKHNQVKNNLNISNYTNMPLIHELDSEMTIKISSNNKIVDLSSIIKNPSKDKIKLITNQPQTNIINSVTSNYEKLDEKCEKQFECHNCHSKFVSLSSLNFHIISKHNASVPKITRVILPPIFTQKNKYITSQGTSHSVNTFRCSVCNMDFVSQYLLNIHNDQFHIAKYCPVNIECGSVDNCNTSSDDSVTLPVQVKTEITVDEMDWDSVSQEKVNQ